MNSLSAEGGRKVSIDAGAHGAILAVLAYNEQWVAGISQGVALGIDRVVMLFGGLDNTRDCIAFPKTQKATDLMTEAPSEVDRKQLRELGIRVVKDEE